jgi:hypothetical protein
MNTTIITSNASNGIYNNNTSINADYMRDINNTSNFYDLYFVINENSEDDIIKNCEINTWRKNYFDYLEELENAVNNQDNAV